MANTQKRRPSGGGTGADDLRQEIEIIIQHSTEPWVIHEAEIIREARTFKVELLRALGIEPISFDFGMCRRLSEWDRMISAHSRRSAA